MRRFLADLPVGCCSSMAFAWAAACGLLRLFLLLLRLQRLQSLVSMLTAPAFYCLLSPIGDQISYLWGRGPVGYLAGAV